MKLIGYWDTQKVCFYYASHIPGNALKSALIPLYSPAA